MANRFRADAYAGQLVQRRGNQRQFLVGQPATQRHRVPRATATLDQVVEALAIVIAEWNQRADFFQRGIEILYLLGNQRQGKVGLVVGQYGAIAVKDQAARRW